MHPLAMLHPPRMRCLTTILTACFTSGPPPACLLSPVIGDQYWFCEGNTLMHITPGPISAVRSKAVRTQGKVCLDPVQAPQSEHCEVGRAGHRPYPGRTSEASGREAGGNMAAADLSCFTSCPFPGPTRKELEGHGGTFFRRKSLRGEASLPNPGQGQNPPDSRAFEPYLRHSAKHQHTGTAY